MPSNKVYTFTVEGIGKFPFDMLRYDQCYPRTQQDTINLTPLEPTIGYTVKRQVTLVSIRATVPTIARWESFGWNVVSGNTRSTAHLGVRR